MRVGVVSGNDAVSERKPSMFSTYVVTSNTCKESRAILMPPGLEELKPGLHVILMVRVFDMVELSDTTAVTILQYSNSVARKH